MKPEHEVEFLRGSVLALKRHIAQLTDEANTARHAHVQTRDDHQRMARRVTKLADDNRWLDARVRELEAQLVDMQRLRVA